MDPLEYQPVEMGGPGMAELPMVGGASAGDGPVAVSRPHVRRPSAVSKRALFSHSDCLSERFEVRNDEPQDLTGQSEGRLLDLSAR
jgi:hypothetical protein